MDYRITRKLFCKSINYIIMKRLKNYLKLGVFLFGIAVTLTNCQKDDIIDFATEEQSKISIKSITLKEGKQDIALRNMLNDIEQKQHILSRTIMENEYNFTVVDHDVNVLIKEDYTSYTILIERLEQDDQYFENLVVEVVPDEETKAYIVKYTPDNIDYMDIHDSYNFEGDVDITPINYDNTLAKETCIEVTILYCNNDGDGGFGETHIAGANCISPDHLFEETIKECWEEVASADPFDETSSTPGGGGSSGSGGSPSNNNDPTDDEGIVVVDQPVKVKGGVNTAPVVPQEDAIKTKLEILTEVDKIKNRIKAMYLVRNSATKELASTFSIDNTDPSGYNEHVIPDSDLKFAGTKMPTVTANSKVFLHLHHNTQNEEGGKVEPIPSDEDWYNTALLYYQRKHLNPTEAKDVVVLTVSINGVYAFVIKDEAKAETLATLVAPELNDGTPNKFLSNIKKQEYNDDFYKKITKEVMENCSSCNDTELAEMFQSFLTDWLNNQESDSIKGISLYHSPIIINQGGDVTFNWSELTNF